MHLDPVTFALDTFAKRDVCLRRLSIEIGSNSHLFVPRWAAKYSNYILLILCKSYSNPQSSSIFLPLELGLTPLSYLRYIEASDPRLTK